MATISSTSFDTLAGSGTIDIEHASLAGGTTFELKEIGSVKGTYDIEESSDQATSVLFNLGEIKFTAFDHLSDGGSLFADLDALSATDQIVVTLNFTTNAARTITDSFFFTLEDIEYDRDARETAINAVKFTTEDMIIPISDLFDNVGVTTPAFDAGDIDEFDITGNGISDEDCVDARTFVVKALELLNSNNTVVLSSGNFSVTGRTAGDTFIVVDDAGAGQTNVDELLFEMAASEGAIVGSLMGYNFFNNRNNFTTAVASLSEDDVLEESLKIRPGLDAYVAIDVNFEGNSNNFSTWTSRTRLTTLNEVLDATETSVDVVDDSLIAADDVILVNQELMLVQSKASNTLTVVRGWKSIAQTHDNGDTVEAVYNADADKTLGITFRNNVMAYANFDTGSSQYKDVGGVANDVAEDGRDSYADAYGASKARKIELTVLGIESVKPYEAIELDSSFPSLIQNQVFRPSEIEYLFSEDMIKIKAYKIN